MLWKTNQIRFLTSSLQRKLVLALMASVTVVIGFAGIYLLNSQQQASLSGLEARAAHLTNLLCKTLAGPMWNIDMKSIGDQLDAAMTDHEIYSVTLSQHGQSQPLISKKRDEQAVDTIAREASVFYASDPQSPPAELGKVKVAYTLAYVHRAFGRTRLIILAALVLLIAVLFATTDLLLRRMVQKPVGQLLATVQRITNGDFDAKMPVKSDDEIGLLSAGVNNMTDKLKETMDGLVRSEQNYRTINETLESMVQERTDELNRSNIELHEHIAELEQFSRLTIEREERMIELKDEINKLLEQTGKEKKYTIVE